MRKIFHNFISKTDENLLSTYYALNYIIFWLYICSLYPKLWHTLMFLVLVIVGCPYDQVHAETSEKGTKKKGSNWQRKVDLGLPKDETEVPS